MSQSQQRTNHAQNQFPHIYIFGGKKRTKLSAASPGGRGPVRRHQAPAQAGLAARAGARRAAGEAARPSGPGAAGSGRLRREARPGSGRLRREARPASPGGTVCPGGGTRRNRFKVPAGALGGQEAGKRVPGAGGGPRASFLFFSFVILMLNLYVM